MDTFQRNKLPLSLLNGAERVKMLQSTDATYYLLHTEVISSGNQLLIPINETSFCRSQSLSLTHQKCHTYLVRSELYRCERKDCYSRW